MGGWTAGQTEGQKANHCRQGEEKMNEETKGGMEGAQCFIDVRDTEKKEASGSTHAACNSAE